MKSRTDEETADYSRRTTNLGEIFGCKLKSVGYKLTLGKLSFSASLSSSKKQKQKYLSWRIDVKKK